MSKTKDRYDGVYMRGTHYYISYTDAAGNRRQVATDAMTLTQARDIREQKRTEARELRKQGLTALPPPPKETTTNSFAEFAPRYLEYQQQRLTPKAYERTRGIVENHLCRHLGAMRLADIRRSNVNDYITQRSKETFTRSKARGKKKSKKARKPVGNGSIIKEFNVLKHMLRHAVCEELIEVNYAHGVKPPKSPAGRVRYLQPTEVPGLLAECPPWLQPIVLLLLSTGMRRGELLALRWLDVDRTGNRLLLPQTKNGEGRTVHLNALACRVMDSLKRPAHPKEKDTVFPQTEKYSPENVSLAFLRACRRAKIENFRLHDLRHTCASWIRMKGEDIHAVAVLLGHKDLRMAMRYQHLAEDFLLNASRRLDDVFTPALADILPQQPVLEPAKEAATVVTMCNIRSANRHKLALTGPTPVPRKQLRQQYLSQ